MTEILPGVCERRQTAAELYLRANIESKDPQQIISGNEKVVRRVWRMPSSSSTPTVKNVLKKPAAPANRVVPATVGDAARQTDRIQALAGWIAEQIGADVNTLPVRVCCLSAT